MASKKIESEIVCVEDLGDLTAEKTCLAVTESTFKGVVVDVVSFFGSVRGWGAFLLLTDMATFEWQSVFDRAKKQELDVCRKDEFEMEKLKFCGSKYADSWASKFTQSLSLDVKKLGKFNKSWKSAR